MDEKRLYIKIEGYWWLLKASIAQLVIGNRYRVENCLGGYHFHTLMDTDEVKSFAGREAWEENDRLDEKELKESDELHFIYSGSFNGNPESAAFPLGKGEGYITREGRFIDVSSYADGKSVSAHTNYCAEKGIDEERMLSEHGWVKLTKCLDSGYIFYGRHLSEEQVELLEEMGYTVEEEDL